MYRSPVRLSRTGPKTQHEDIRVVNPPPDDVKLRIIARGKEFHARRDVSGPEYSFYDRLTFRRQVSIREETNTCNFLFMVSCLSAGQGRAEGPGVVDLLGPQEAGAPSSSIPRSISSTARPGQYGPGRAPGDGDRNLLRGIHAPSRRSP